MVTVYMLLIGQFCGIDLDATLGAFTLELTYNRAAGGATASLLCCASM